MGLMGLIASTVRPILFSRRYKISNLCLPDSKGAMLNDILVDTHINVEPEPQRPPAGRCTSAPKDSGIFITRSRFVAFNVLIIYWVHRISSPY